jgi:branched-chain amino acid transport system substrate-binding protein
MKFNRFVLLAGLAFAAGTLSAPAQAQETKQDTLKIGWAISKTGPFAAGAAVTTLPNYPARASP